jgi:hypothetical protein
MLLNVLIFYIKLYLFLMQVYKNVLYHNFLNTHKNLLFLDFLLNQIIFKIKNEHLNNKKNLSI